MNRLRRWLREQRERLRRRPNLLMHAEAGEVVRVEWVGPSWGLLLADDSTYRHPPVVREYLRHLGSVGSGHCIYPLTRGYARREGWRAVTWVGWCLWAVGERVRRQVLCVLYHWATRHGCRPEPGTVLSVRGLLRGWR